MKKKITLKDILILQAVIAIYTLSTVMASWPAATPHYHLFLPLLRRRTRHFGDLRPFMAADDKKIRIIHCLYKPGHGPALVPYLGRSNIS